MLPIGMTAQHFRPLILMVLLLAACGLAGHFVTDALCGSYLITEHDCQERSAPGSSLPTDYCCSHPSFVPLEFSVLIGTVALLFAIPMTALRLVSAALHPPFHPPVLTLASF